MESKPLGCQVIPYVFLIMPQQSKFMLPCESDMVSVDIYDVTAVGVTTKVNSFSSSPRAFYPHSSV